MTSSVFAPLLRSSLLLGVAQAMHQKAFQRAGVNASAAQAPTALNEVFTQNVLCRQNNCVNPLFPGLNDLVQLEQLVWQCSTASAVSSHLDFCQGAILHDPALPSPNSSSQLISNIVKAQDQSAATMFFYHLNGMGYDAWEHTETSPRLSEDPCVKSVWNMVCYTYFPKADSACQSGEQSSYNRPCSGACTSYLSSCQVECCDESPRCIFSHRYEDAQGQSMIQTGYHQDVGPSAFCTGQASASRGLQIPFLLLLGLLGIHLSASDCEGAPGASTSHATAALARNRKRTPWIIGACLVVCALCLQGCDLSIPRHNVGNWRQNRDYLVAFEYTPPGETGASAELNSCAMDIAPALQCSGHGYCRGLNSFRSSSQNIVITSPSTTSFCYCDAGWADPECRTRRKSQLVTFLLSIFFGMFGADYFYLGFPLWGLAKLFTAGGLGTWWLLDIVRTGAGPIYAYNYRTANDLPHWVFVVATVAVFMLCGFLVSVESYLSHRRRKRADVLKMHEQEEAEAMRNYDKLQGPRAQAATRSVAGNRSFQGYGATMLPVGPVAPDAGAYAYAQFRA